jgi:hypothetical protein
MTDSGALQRMSRATDWFVTFLSAAGVPDIAERPRAGTDLNGTTYKVHLDGHIFLFVPAQAYVAQMLETLVEFPAAAERGTRAVIRLRRGGGRGLPG